MKKYQVCTSHRCSNCCRFSLWSLAGIVMILFMRNYCINLIFLLRFIIQFVYCNFMARFQLFQENLKKFSQPDHWTRKLEHLEDSYALRRYRISQISITEAQTLLQNIEKKFYKLYQKGSCSMWFQNELRLFIWMLICYMELYKKHIKQFTSQDWKFFSDILYVKSPVLFQYQAKITIDYSLCLRKWSLQQDSLLTKIILSAIKLKWNEIAKVLFETSQGQFIRTSKQCRERWLNHLDPSKTKLSWSLVECKLLLESVIEKGKKWASLVQNLKGRRSEHSIKNKYNSMVIKQKKLNPQLSQTQICRIILEKIIKILTTKTYSEQDQFIFTDSIKFIGQLEQNKIIDQKVNASEELMLEKSNSSLEKSQQTRPNCQLSFTLNVDDIFTNPNQKNIGSSSANMMGKLRSTNMRKKMPSYADSINKKEQNQMILEENDNSLLYLDDLQLVIRESQLDK